MSGIPKLQYTNKQRPESLQISKQSKQNLTTKVITTSYWLWYVYPL